MNLENLIHPGKTPGENVRLVIYGPAGVGKTYLTKSCPDVLYINSDNNTVGLKNVITIRDSQRIKNAKGVLVTLNVREFLDYIYEAIKDSDQFKTIVFDLGDHIYEMCRQLVLKPTGCDDEQQVTVNGKPDFMIYKKVYQSFIKPIEKFLDLKDKNIIIICKEKEKRKFFLDKDYDPEEPPMVVPNISEKVMDNLSWKLDFVLRMEYLSDKGKVIRNEQGELVRIFRSMGKYVKCYKRFNIPERIAATWDSLIDEYKKAVSAEGDK